MTNSDYIKRIKELLLSGQKENVALALDLAESNGFFDEIFNDLEPCIKSVASCSISNEEAIKKMTSREMIVFVVNLETLFCSNTEIESLDLSACANLETLDCHNTNIESLDLSACANLETLFCSNTNIESLDLSACANLVYLDCSNTVTR